ncbi:uncharacterized protein MKK02DRAFT_39359 [Dioszegia hungarica]|uniref:Uncharacterized protein n=1 Tax=Dioszegia hungarica TaxID=4972 RepID=A0AA38HFH1_9TREE|nr:uncharacterized protein MKK02DRAFT_39359 [Dioszegia hungarica]KAI9639082.1 hypothetical protein MKK02DRAFT_39359 [Dioszegia hungarica]
MISFQRHLQYFSSSTTSQQITILSALRAGLQLGLDFPVALFLSIGIRVLYGRTLISPVVISSIPPHSHRTQLDTVPLDEKKRSYSARDILALYAQDPKADRGLITSVLDRAHILSFWAIAARPDHMVDAADLKRFRQGGWETDVVERRRGRGDVLPLWRGGPIIVRAHSWFVRRLFGVRVYERSCSWLGL